MSQTIYCTGLSYKSTPVEMREKAYLPVEAIQAILPVLIEKFSLLEVAVLSTCNRFEMYCVANNNEDVYAAWYFLLGSKLSKEEILPHTYFYLHRSAVHHVFSVASSLDSLVVGETQITGQFKDAIQMSEEAETCGLRLNRLTQEALATAKKVRSKTVIGQKTVSIGHAAVDLARRVYGVFQEHRLLLIGAGHMSQTTAHYALRHKPLDIWVTNRTQQKAEDLVENIGCGKAFPLHNLYDLLLEVDVIISCTGANEFIIDSEKMAPVIKKRGARPLIMVDIAVPKDIDPQCQNFDEVYLFDVDDLQQVVNKNLDERKQAAEQARVFIEAATDRFLEWLETRSLKPAIVEFKSYIESIIKSETQKTLSRKVFNDQEPGIEKAIQSMQNSICQKITSDVAKALSNPDLDYRREHLTSALQTLFQKKEK